MLVLYGVLSRASDLSGQIWGALWLLLTAGVHCRVLSLVGKLPTSISVNKGWPTSYSILLHQRSTGWSMWCFFILFMRWEGEDELHRSSSFIPSLCSAVLLSPLGRPWRRGRGWEQIFSDIRRGMVWGASGICAPSGDFSSAVSFDCSYLRSEG